MIERRQDTAPAFCAPSAPPPVLILEGEPTSARAAREFTREFVLYYAPEASEDYVGTVQLVVSELVTNAIRYGTETGGSLRLLLDADHTHTRVEVQDSVRLRPSPRPPSKHPQDGGRGLIILDALCLDWGTIEDPFGKTVWAEVKAS
ncbi:ATP-binding protein [Streptomyces niveiscabiei]|uniref:ATP-binding protein n=1 Tax=Streptomyces niveiscabiei TaxID=164115 RepID=A0ABW9I0N6_9ACTN